MDEPEEPAEQQLPKEQADFDENEATVLSPASTLQAKDLPTGMTPRELAHTLQGEMLDHFQLQQFVGGGGMGVVFKALDTTLDRIVAVKVVASHSLSTEDLQKRFLVEAQSAARLDHPNIARIYDSGRSRGLPYIVFEFIEGANIRDLVINHGPLPLGDALSYTHQIAQALLHASQRDVIHRDIKPSNILVTRDGLAKLVDMGLARFYQVDSKEDDLTTTGVTLGTFDYISPEQARDPRAADTRSDIYSLGCTLFFMLAGHAPFSQGTPAQKLLQHQGDQPPDLLELRSDIPVAVVTLVQRMLAKQPEDRPQSPSEIVAILADLMHSLGLQAPQALAPPIAPLQQAPQAWRQHLPWVLPVAALLLVSGLMYSTGSQRPVEPQWPLLRTTDSSSKDVSVEPSYNEESTAEPTAIDPDTELNTEVATPPLSSAGSEKVSAEIKDSEKTEAAATQPKAKGEQTPEDIDLKDKQATLEIEPLQRNSLSTSDTFPAVENPSLPTPEEILEESD